MVVNSRMQEVTAEIRRPSPQGLIVVQPNKGAAPPPKADGQPIRCNPLPKSMRARSARETIPSLGNTLAR